MDDSKNNVPSFIGKLGLMLKDKSATPFVTWSQGGESVVVLDPPTFATQVLPRCSHSAVDVAPPCVPCAMCSGCSSSVPDERRVAALYEQVLQAQQLRVVCQAVELVRLPQDFPGLRLVRVLPPHFQVRGAPSAPRLCSPAQDSADAWHPNAGRGMSIFSRTAAERWARPRLAPRVRM